MRLTKEDIMEAAHQAARQDNWEYLAYLVNKLLLYNPNAYEDMLRNLGRSEIKFFNNNRDKKIIWLVEGTDKVLELTYTRDGDYISHEYRARKETDRF